MEDELFYKAKGSIFCQLAEIVRANTDIADPMYPQDILFVLGSGGLLHEQLTDSDLETIYSELYSQEVTV